MGYVVLQMVVFLLVVGVLGFVAGWMLRGWGLDGSTRMSDGYEREQRATLLRELNNARTERDDARTKMLAMRAALPCAPAAIFKRESAVPAPAPAPQSPLPLPEASQESRPAPVSPNDDLKKIKGIGPRLEQKLIAMGVTRFGQIAAWTDEEIAAVNASLRFSGRIERDRWVEQARVLAAE